MRWKFKNGETDLQVELLHSNENSFCFRVGDEEVTLRNPRTYPFSIETDFLHLSLEAWTTSKWRAVHGERTISLEPQSMGATASASSGEIRTQMPGRVLKVLVEKGQEIKAKQTLLILEAMKMENEIRSEADGIVETIHVQQGQSLESGVLLISLRSL